MSPSLEKVIFLVQFFRFQILLQTYKLNIYSKRVNKTFYAILLPFPSLKAIMCAHLVLNYLSGSTCTVPQSKERNYLKFLHIYVNITRN